MKIIKIIFLSTVFLFSWTAFSDDEVTTKELAKKLLLMSKKVVEVAEKLIETADLEESLKIAEEAMEWLIQLERQSKKLSVPKGQLSIQMENVLLWKKLE